MAVFVLCLLVLLAITSHSSATYCICKDGLSDPVYQKNIDYACGQGADCTAIQDKGACYNPSTVKDHCNYAVNSYYQRKGQVPGSCDFSGSATTTASLTSQSSTCVYPSSASPAGTTPTTPSTGTPTTPATGTVTPTTPSTGTITPTTPATGTITPTTPSTGINSPPTGINSPPTGINSPPTGTNSPPTGMTPPSTGNTFGSPPSSVFGLGPTSINPSTDKAHSIKPFFWAFILFSGPLFFFTI